jgi:hypothetical protein
MYISISCKEVYQCYSFKRLNMLVARLCTSVSRMWKGHPPPGRLHSLWSLLQWGRKHGARTSGEGFPLSPHMHASHTAAGSRIQKTQWPWTDKISYHSRYYSQQSPSKQSKNQHTLLAYSFNVFTGLWRLMLMYYSKHCDCHCAANDIPCQCIVKQLTYHDNAAVDVSFNVKKKFVILNR